MKYFKNVSTIEELRREYKKLLKENHPDNGGSEEATKQINLEYEKMFEMLKDKHEQQTKEKAEGFSYKWDAEIDRQIREAIQKIIHLDVEIEIVGTWVWVSGNTYPVREQLKEAGFKYIGKRKMWAVHFEQFHKKSKKEIAFDEIRNYYGSEKVERIVRPVLAGC